MKYARIFFYLLLPYLTVWHLLIHGTPSNFAIRKLFIGTDAYTQSEYLLHQNYIKYIPISSRSIVTNVATLRLGLLQVVSMREYEGESGWRIVRLTMVYASKIWVTWGRLLRERGRSC